MNAAVVVLLLASISKSYSQSCFGENLWKVQSGFPVSIPCKIPNEEAPNIMSNATVWVHGNATYVKNTTIEVTSRDLFCRNQSDILWKDDRLLKNSKIGRKIVKRFAWECDLHVSDSQRKKLQFTVFKDCEMLRPGDDVVMEFLSETKELRLELTNLSYSETPGYYFSVAIYKERRYLLHRYPRLTCLRAGAKSSNIPVILPESTTYNIVPGQNLMISCSAEGAPADLANSDVIWRSKVKNGRICEPASIDVVTMTAQNRGSLRTNYTITNASPEDIGNYSCQIGTTRGWDTKFILVTFKEQPNVEDWLIAVIVVVAILVIVLGVVVIYFLLRTEIKYLTKKHFQKEITVPKDKSVAFLIYCSDTFDNNTDANPLKDLMEWMESKNMRYNDPNGPSGNWNWTVPASENIEEAIRNSMSLIVIVSKKLLVENDSEILSTYMGFDHNVNSSQPLIFICTEKLRKIVFGGDKFKDPVEQESASKTIQTFKNFMKRRTNFVVCWSPTKLSRFQRGLYVALPKVKPLSEE